jgi:hypothetical protein
VERALEVRFLSPAHLKDIRFSGAVSDAAWREEEGVTAIRLRAAGACSVTATAAEPQ